MHLFLAVLFWSVTWALLVSTTWWQVVSKNELRVVFTFAMDLSDALPDIITVLLGNMGLQQRFTCALVCSDWAKIATAATTQSIVRHGVRDVTGLKKWLDKNGSQIKTLQLHVDCQTDMAGCGLPCAQLTALPL